MKKNRTWLLIALSLACLVAPASAQSMAGLGAINGTVKDPSGAVIPGATVQLEVGGVVTAQAQTSGDGRFSFATPSGPIRLIFDAATAEQAAVMAFQWTCDKQVEIQAASPLDHLLEAEQRGWQLSDEVMVNEQGFGRWDGEVIPCFAFTNTNATHMATWSGLYVPSATARDIVQHIDSDILKIKNAAEFKKRMLQQGIDQSEADTPGKHAAFLRAEFVRWGKVIEEAGVRAE